MKFLKQFGIFLLIILVVVTVLSLVMPVSQRIERSITINARAAVVYDYLSRLSNFNRWSVWNQNDSTLRNTITGTDGTLGAVNNWVGDPSLSGEGKMTITSLEINQEIEHHISFIKPRKMEADSEFDLQEINGQTKVTWKFDLATPRPWNIFNLFSSMEKRMEKDFESGLRNLKAAIEKNKVVSTVKSYDVLPLNYPSTSFAYYRQQVKTEDIAAFYAQYLPRIYEQAITLNATPGSPCGLIYSISESDGSADIAAAIPVPEGTTFQGDSIQVIDIPGSKAIYVDYYGAYDRTQEAYNSIRKYLSANSLQQKTPVIEQYITDPAVQKDTAKWLTRIIFLVE